MVDERARRVPCPGCGASVRDIPGNPHKYIGAAGGCWEIYGHILAKEYGEYRYPEPTHQLTVHTYAVQHPGRPSRQSIQSVTLHLVGLYCILERGLTATRSTQIMDRVLVHAHTFVWLEPPVPNGRMTVLDVAPARDRDEHRRVVEQWARDVWGAWTRHHDHTKRLTESVLPP